MKVNKTILCNSLELIFIVRHSAQGKTIVSRNTKGPTHYIDTVDNRWIDECLIPIFEKKSSL